MSKRCFVVPIPLNADGHGPVERDETVRVIYEVWDYDLRSVATFDDQHDAAEYAAEVNAKEPKDD